MLDRFRSENFVFQEQFERDADEGDLAVYFGRVRRPHRLIRRIFVLIAGNRV